MHHMSHHSLGQLQQIFARTSIGENFSNQKSKRFPIFLNFEPKMNGEGYGRSQLDIAIDAYDFESFNHLLHATV